MEEKAKYQVSSAMHNEILEIAVKGEVSECTYENVVNDVNVMIKANNAKKVIADFRGIDRRIAPSEMYRYFRTYNAVLFEITYAIVDLPENVQYKTAAINAGLSSLNWFTDMDAARKCMESK